MKTFVATGAPNRPAGFPCFHCGVQVTTETCVQVDWADGSTTIEAVCVPCDDRTGEVVR